MVIRTENAFLDNELLLARLLLAKLVLRLHGIISVGLASLESDSPRDFLVGRDKTVRALMDVLGSLTIGSAHDAIQQSLVAQAGRMALLWNTFYEDFLALGEWRTLLGAEMRNLGDRLISTYSEIERLSTAFNKPLMMKLRILRRSGPGKYSPACWTISLNRKNGQKTMGQTFPLVRDGLGGRDRAAYRPVKDYAKVALLPRMMA